MKDFIFISLLLAILVLQVAQHKRPEPAPKQNYYLLRKQYLDLMKHHLVEATKYNESSDPSEQALKNIHVELSEHYSKLYIKLTAITKVNIK